MFVSVTFLHYDIMIITYCALLWFTVGIVEI